MENSTCNISRWQILKTHLNNLLPAEFEEMVRKTPDAVVIDVRTESEFLQGHLFDAINISYLAYDFWDRIETLDRKKPYFIYCRSGRRSIRTCTLMQNGGFSKVYNLDGGINVWQEASDTK